jgi:hypothetical protein
MANLEWRIAEGCRVQAAIRRSPFAIREVGEALFCTHVC